MNRGEIKALVSYWVDDLNFGYFTGPQLDLFIDNAQFEAAKMLIQAGNNYYLKCKETTLVPSQCLYALPDDFLKVNRLEVVTSGVCPQEDSYRLEAITLNQQDILFPKIGQPEAYVIKKSALRIFPAPNVAQTLRLEYTQRVQRMSADADVPDCPEQYHELIALYAARDCLIKDGREATLIANKIAFYEEMMKQDSQERNVDQPRYVVMTGDDGRGSMF